jgi:signal transduction histidine kinase
MASGFGLSGHPVKPPKHKKNRALPLTITLGSLLLFFCLALTTLWNIVLVYNYFQLDRLKQYAGPAVQVKVWNQWIILGIGSFLFVVIIVGITLFIIFMARQIIVNQLQKNFIDSVTHELKTPLTSLRLYIETLQRHDLPKDKQAQFFDTMLKDVEHLDILLNHVLEAAKAEYSGAQQPLTLTDLDPIVQDAMAVVLRRYQLAPETMVYHPTGLTVLSDPPALKLVLINLLDNAVKYSADPPQITLQAEVLPTGALQLQVCDQGYGIAPAELNKIFNRFYRSALTGSQKGNGLGLFIVRETVRRLRGKVSAASAGKDQGSCFSLVLPRA